MSRDEIPLAGYGAADPAFRASHLGAIRRVVDGQVAGALWVREVGLVPG
jgi:hypothetical protein